MDEEGSEDFQSILTFGAKTLFEEDDESAREIVCTSNDVTI